MDYFRFTINGNRGGGTQLLSDTGIYGITILAWLGQNRYIRDQINTAIGNRSTILALEYHRRVLLVRPGVEQGRSRNGFRT